MTKYKIADVVFGAEIVTPYLKGLCAPYEYIGERDAEVVFKISRSEVEKVLETFPSWSVGTAESEVLLNKFASFLVESGRGFMFHSSAVAVDGKAYLFTALSGVGKSTHARLWRELLGEKAEMVNDDKPCITVKGGKVFVHGTPWQGKHNLGSNTQVEVEAICKISRANTNEIRRGKISEMIITFLEQTIRPTEKKSMDNLVDLVEKVITSVSIYSLSCDKSLESAKLSYNAMVKGNL